MSTHSWWGTPDLYKTQKMMKIIKNIDSLGENTLGWGWESRKSTFWTPKMPKFRRKNDENHENHEKTENRLFLAIYGGVPPRMTKILSQTRKMMSRDRKITKIIKNPVPDRVGDPCGGGAGLISTPLPLAKGCFLGRCPYEETEQKIIQKNDPRPLGRRATLPFF